MDLTWFIIHVGPPVCTSKDETKYEDMIDILEHIQSYVPSKYVRKGMGVPRSDEVVSLEDQDFATTLMGGDQLTWQEHGCPASSI